MVKERIANIFFINRSNREYMLVNIQNLVINHDFLKVYSTPDYEDQ